MRIGLISDNHHAFDRLELALDKLLNEGIDRLLHAGDMGHERVLARLGALEVPAQAVFGNNDYAFLEQQPRYAVELEPWCFAVGDLKIKLMHLPKWLHPEGADLVVFGHTHLPAARVHGQSLIINPGEVCGRESGLTQCAIVERLSDRWQVRQFHHCGQTWREENQELPFG